MFSLHKLSLGCTTLIILVLGSLLASEAKATSLKWNYRNDSFEDGFGGSNGVYGASSDYEIYRMAYAYDHSGGRFYVAINSNLPLSGLGSNPNVGYGDMFFNYSGKNFSNSNGQSKLFGVRFASNNDSGVSSLGVYSNVTAQSITSTNSGFASLESYKSTIQSDGNDASLGDIDKLGENSENWSYFNEPGDTPVYNAIQSGVKISNDGFQLYNDQDLKNTLGLNFGTQNLGTNTFGFSFDATKLVQFGVNPTDEFIAHLFAECGNDGMGIIGKMKEVPEPSALIGLLVVGGILKSFQGRKVNNS
jgi:hypothetical protein